MPTCTFQHVPWCERVVCVIYLFWGIYGFERDARRPVILLLLAIVGVGIGIGLGFRQPWILPDPP